jgi:hypothetical protein
MTTEHEVGAVRLSARLRGVSPLVTRRIWIREQASLAELHAVLQVAFGWNDEHLYALQIRGWQFGDPSRAIELALAGDGVDSALAAFGFELGEPFLYQYNLFVPWEIDCRIEARGLIRAAQPVTCLATRGSGQLPTRFAWRRSTRNGPLSKSGPIAANRRPGRTRIHRTDLTAIEGISDQCSYPMRDDICGRHSCHYFDTAAALLRSRCQRLIDSFAGCTLERPLIAS